MDFTRAQLWDRLDAAASGRLSSVAGVDRFASALSARNYLVSDALASSWLKCGMVADRDGGSLYDEWRYRAGRLEAFNVALFWAAKRAVLPHRLIGSIDEFDNYQRGRWRQAGDLLDRASLTVGASNPILGERDALVAYDARLLAGCIQPVRYSPYPRLDEGGREGFGSEKYAAYAGEAEVHLYAGCPTLSRDPVNMLLFGDAKRRRAEIVARHGEAGVFH